MPKKFLDANGLTYFTRILDNYPNNELLGTVITAIEDELEKKENSLVVKTTWPENNIFLNNSLYYITETITTSKTLTIEDGSAANDMIYISFIVGQGGGVTFQGNNLINNLIYINQQKAFYEFMGFWHPVLHKWIISTKWIENVI